MTSYLGPRTPGGQYPKRGRPLGKVTSAKARSVRVTIAPPCAGRSYAASDG